MRRLVATVLVGFLLLFAACSYITDFVIVNESDSPVIVRYVVKDFPGSFYVPTEPKVVAASQLSEDGRQWNPVHFEVDEASRSVTTQLMPGQALRVAVMHHYSGHDDPGDAENFQIRQITVTGIRGELNLTDDQARTTFTRVARTLYTLTYR